MDNGLNQGTPSIGIVIIGRNEGERLIRSLCSMRSYKDKAVYVVSGSSDNSGATARRLGFRVLELDPSAPFSAARARNEGVQQLINLRFPDMKFIQFVDGDCELAEGWIPEAEQFLLQHPKVAAVCGRRRER